MMTKVNVNSECLGLVLAGGLSSRMGRDKALLTLPQVNSSQLEQTMLSFSQSLLKEAGIDDIAVSGANVGGIEDIYPNGGPLSGIFSAIKAYQPKAILALPIDMPFLSARHLSELKLAGQLSQKAMIFNGSSLPIYLPINALVEQALTQDFTSEQYTKLGKGPSFKHIFKLAQGKVLPCKNDQALLNTNTPEQWQQAMNQLSKIPG